MDFPYRHLCLLHDKAGVDPLRVAAGFLARGLRAGGRALFLGSPEMLYDMRCRLDEEGIDVRTRMHSGALLLVSEQTHFHKGRFDTTTQLAHLKETYNRAIRDGYAGLWGAGDIGWEFQSERDFSSLLVYESALDNLFKQLPNFHALCHYHTDELPSHVIGSALLSHRALYMNDFRQRPNPFFTPLSESPAYIPNASQVDRMLQLLAAR